jgi:TAP-like protein
MLSGEVDLRTPVETAISAAADWPRARRLTVPGTGHSTLSSDYTGCAQRAAARFLRRQSVAASCRRGQPLVPPLPPAPLRLRELRAAPQVAGERGRTISAVDLTLLDVATEFFTSLFTSTGPVVRGGGLRGGRWELDVRGGEELLRLHAVEYLPGLRLSGTVSRFLSRRPAGRLRVSGPAGAEGLLRWTPRLIEGELDGERVRSQLRGAAARASAGRATAWAAGPTRAQVLRAGQLLAERRRAPR